MPAGSSTASAGNVDADNARAVDEQPTLRELRRRSKLAVDQLQVLDIAEELFVERGYRDTTLKLVAERSEFSIGSIYKLFASKDDLYRAVLYRHLKQEAEEVRAVAASGGPPLDRMLALIAVHLDRVDANPGWGKLINGMFSFGAILTASSELESADADRRQFFRWIDLNAQVIAEGQRDGSIRAGNPRALSRLLAAMVGGYQLMDPRISDDAEDFSRSEFLESVEAFLRA